MERFFSVLTAAGEAAMARYGQSGAKTPLVDFAVGDGGGNYYLPNKDMTSLRREKWRGRINDVTIDPQKPNVFIITALVPHEVGGFIIREGAVYNDDGEMIGIMNTPNIEKSAGEGADAQLYLRMRLAVSHTDAIEFPIDPNVIMISKPDAIELVQAYAAPKHHTQAAETVKEATGETTEESQRRQDYAIKALQEQLDTGFVGKAFAWGFTAADMSQWQGFDGALPEGIWDTDNNRMTARGGTA